MAKQNGWPYPKCEHQGCNSLDTAPFGVKYVRWFCNRHWRAWFNKIQGSQS